LPRFSANLSTLFPGLPLGERFGRARALGFELVEVQYPYELPPPALAQALRDNGQEMVLINAPAGTGPERGLATLPGRERDFRDSVAQALDYAQALDVPLVHVLAGIPDRDTPRETSAALARDNLAWAVEQASSRGVRLVVEVLNGIDVPGYFLRSLDDAAELIAESGDEGLRLLFDVYHCKKSGGDPVREMRRHASLIAHIQIADVPERFEPGTGSVDWPAVFATIEAIGYEGPIGCEFAPRDAAGPDMSWISRLQPGR